MLVIREALSEDEHVVKTEHDDLFVENFYIIQRFLFKRFDDKNIAGIGNTRHHHAEDLCHLRLLEEYHNHSNGSTSHDKNGMKHQAPFVICFK